MASIASPDGVVLLTWANHHYLDFAMNWVGHLQLLGVTAYMVGALDNAFLKVQRHTIPSSHWGPYGPAAEAARGQCSDQRETAKVLFYTCSIQFCRSAAPEQPSLITTGICRTSSRWEWTMSLQCKRICKPGTSVGAAPTSSKWSAFSPTCSSSNSKHANGCY